MLPSQEDVQSLAIRLKQRYGDLEDLPNELRNTVANVEYRILLLARNPAQSLGRELLKGGSGQRFVRDAAFYASIGPTLPELIDNVRNLRTAMDKGEVTPALYNYTVELLLDIMKHKIDKAHKKSALRRAVERRFVSQAQEEIPQLYEVCKRYAG